MGRLIKGVMHPVGPRPGSRHRARIINAASRARTEPLVHSRLDGLMTKENPRICIFRRLGGIGDVIMTTPLVKHIKRLIPRCHLVYATDIKYSNGALADVLRGNPFVDEIVSFQGVTSRDFDLFTDVTATGLDREKGGSVPPNRIDMFAEQVGVDITMDPLPTYVMTPDESEWAKKKFEEYCLPHKREEVTVIGIQGKSNDKRRTWPLDHTKKLIEMLTKDPKVRVVIFFWQKDTHWHMPQTFVAGESLRYTAALVNECDVMVTPDSSLLHVAGALQKKTVAIFGPVSPESRINYYPNTTAITAGLACCPCWYSPTCGNKLQCLTEITPKAVFDAIQQKLVEQEKVQEVISIAGSQIDGFRPDNVVLVKRHWGGYGDIMMTIPGIEALKDKYPSKKIYYAIPKKYWPAAENNPHIDKLLDATRPTQQNRYAVVIDISSPCAQYESSKIQRGNLVDLNRVEIFAQALGTRQYIKNIRPKYYPSEEEVEWAREFLPETDKPRLAVTMKCAESYRDWPIDKYGKLISLVRGEFQIILIDPVREFSRFKGVVDACGFPFRESAAIVSQSDIVLSPDTALVHMAAAMDKELVALFGPIDAKVRCKGYNNTKVIVANMDCVPCWRNSKTPCKKSGSVTGYSECMKNISVKTVYESLMELKERRDA